MAVGATGAVEVDGLRELIRACNKMSKDLADDLVWELEEAAQPAEKLTEQYILGGGGGFGQMVGVDTYWGGMRIGVSKGQGLVYVVPSWKSNRGTLQGKILALHQRFRMEAAVEDSADKIEKRMEEWIDRMADDWGKGF